MTRLLPGAVILILLAACGPRELEPDDAYDCARCAEWNEPHDPFRVYGNTWYVGTDGLSSILVQTSDGLLLFDGGLTQSASLIVANIRTLGFDPLDIQAIFVSHAHYDHVGGVNALQRMTRARVFTSESGVEPLATGRLLPDDPQYRADSATEPESTDAGGDAVSAPAEPVGTTVAPRQTAEPGP